MNELDALIQRHKTRYPQMQTLDLFKLIYQNEFGSGHLVHDPVHCRERLLSEYRACTAGAQLLEPIGNGYSRLYLGNARTEGYDPGLLADVFLASAHRQDGDAQQFLQKAQSLKAYEDAGEVDQWICWATQNRFAPFSHSEAYRQAYQPAYRVVLDALACMLPLMQEMANKSRERAIVVGLDGRCGSGKTTLAKLLGEVFDCNVIHMDDFFLPPALRTPERMQESGGNVHYERVEAEVLTGLLRGEPFRYGVFDCGQMAITYERDVPLQPITVIEGSYALHPRLNSIYDIKVFCDIDAQTQRERILLRNGEAMLGTFIARWIPMEERYFEAFPIREMCDYVLRTDGK